MKRRIIFFYLMLFGFVFNNNVLFSAPRVKNKKNFRGRRRKKNQNRTSKLKVNLQAIVENKKNIIDNPISEKNTIEDKKQVIKDILSIFIKEIDFKDFNYDIIIKKSIESDKLKAGYKLNLNGDIVDAQNNDIIIFLKSDIYSYLESLKLQENNVKKLVNNVEISLIAASNNSLKRDEKGNIINNNNEIIVASSAIKDAVYEATEKSVSSLNEDLDSYRRIKKDIIKVLEPAMKSLDGAGYLEEEIDTLVYKNMKEKKILTNKFNNQNNNLFSGKLILLDDFEEKSILDLLIKSIIFFSSFNDGIIDVFALLYQFNSNDFIITNENYFYKNKVVFKSFVLEDGNMYAKIKNNIDGFVNSLLVLKDIKNLSAEMKEMLFKINEDINNSSSSLDQKLKVILLYIYGIILSFKNIDENITAKKQDVLKIFIKSFLSNKFILDNINMVLKESIFNKSKIKNINYNDLMNIFDIKFYDKHDKSLDDILLTYNTEFQFILLCSIIYNILYSNDFINLEKELNLFDNTMLEINTVLNQIYNESSQNNIDKKKDVLMNYIKKNYAVGNAVIIKSFLLQHDTDTKKIIFNEEKKIYMRYVEQLRSDSKNSIKNCFPFNRLINIYETVSAIEKNKRSEENINSNIYTIYFNLSKKEYSNQLFKILLDGEDLYPKKVDSNENDEDNKKEAEVENKFDISLLVSNYIDDIEKYQYYTNENNDIIVLINLILNTINIKNYFEALAISDQDDQIKLIYEVLKNTNNYFLEYLQEIFNVLKNDRKTIKKLDKNSYKKLMDKLYNFAWNSDNAIGLSKAALATIGATTAGVFAAFGPEKVISVTGNTVYTIGEKLFDIVKSNPKAATIFAALTGGGWAVKKAYDHAVSSIKNKKVNGQKKLLNINSSAFKLNVSQ